MSASGLIARDGAGLPPRRCSEIEQHARPVQRARPSPARSVCSERALRSEVGGLISLEGGFQRLHSRAGSGSTPAPSPITRASSSENSGPTSRVGRISRNAGLELFRILWRSARGPGGGCGPPAPGPSNPTPAVTWSITSAVRRSPGAFSCASDPFGRLRGAGRRRSRRRSREFRVTRCSTLPSAPAGGRAILVAGITPQDHHHQLGGGFSSSPWPPAGFLDLIGGFRFDYHSVWSSLGSFGSVFRLGDASTPEGAAAVPFAHRRRISSTPAPPSSATRWGVCLRACARAGLKPATAHTGWSWASISG